MCTQTASAINLSILDFKQIVEFEQQYTKFSINLSILDFKQCTYIWVIDIVLSINLSILDFKQDEELKKVNCYEL